MSLLTSSTHIKTPLKNIFEAATTLSMTFLYDDLKLLSILL